jgi:8-oxo-dGTP pyrophosphatase MutT (NUDIX family)
MMDFVKLRSHLKERLRDAHEPVRADAGVREAAVALVLRGRGGAAEMLVIKRAESERDHWSGHLALPGGRREPSDADLRATALRETLEEVGLDVESGGEVLGRLDTVRPESPLAPRIAVTPFVAAAPPEYHAGEAGEALRDVEPNGEVAVAFWVPVSVLKRGGRSEMYRMVVGGAAREWPAYPSPHGPIWGLTERILTRFLALLDER